MDTTHDNTDHILVPGLATLLTELRDGADDEAFVEALGARLLDDVGDAVSSLTVQPLRLDPSEAP